jgi:hypothetical protein
MSNRYLQITTSTQLLQINLKKFIVTSLITAVFVHQQASASYQSGDTLDGVQQTNRSLSNSQFTEIDLNDETNEEKEPTQNCFLCEEFEPSHCTAVCTIGAIIYTGVIILLLSLST